jgi:hypothetical protein
LCWIDADSKTFVTVLDEAQQVPITPVGMVAVRK